MSMSKHFAVIICLILFSLSGCSGEGGAVYTLDPMLTARSTEQVSSPPVPTAKTVSGWFGSLLGNQLKEMESSYQKATSRLDVFATLSGAMVIGSNGKPVFEGECQDFNTVFSQKSGDQKRVCLNVGTALVTVTDEGYDTVHDNVSEWKLSYTGDRIIYTVPSTATKKYKGSLTTGDVAGPYTLFSYNCVDMISTKIDDDVYIPHKPSFTVSPDGRTIGYIADMRIDRDSHVQYEGYLKTEGKPLINLGTDRMNIMVGNDGASAVFAKTVNYLSYVEMYYFVSESGEIEMPLGMDSGYRNESGTEVLYSGTYDTYYFDGKELIEISDDDWVRLVLPGKNFKLFEGWYWSQTSLKTLVKSVFFTGYDLCTLREDKSIAKIDTRIRDLCVNTEYTCALALADDEIIALDLSMNNEERQLVADDVTRFLATDDLKTFYYVDYDSTLWFISDGSERVKVAEDLPDESEWFIPAFSHKLYTIIEKVGGSRGLWYSDDGTKLEMVPGADNIFDAFASGASVYYISNLDRDKSIYNDADRAELFRSNDEGSFTSLGMIKSSGYNPYY